MINRSFVFGNFFDMAHNLVETKRTLIFMTSGTKVRFKLAHVQHGFLDGHTLLQISIVLQYSCGPIQCQAFNSQVCFNVLHTRPLS